MRKTVILLIALLSSLTASAQVVRTWVSTSGNDANPCSREAPCRNFSAAILAVGPGGEVVVLDSGGYGPFSIGFSVSVLAPEGVHAAIAPTTGTAISIGAGSSDRVVLKNLFLDSAGAETAIDFASGITLVIENSVLSGFGLGIDIGAGNSRTYVHGTTFRNNEITLFSFDSGVSVAVSDSEFQESPIEIAPGTRLLLSSSAMSGVSDLVVASSLFAGVAEIVITDCLLMGTASADGIVALGPAASAIVTVSRTAVVNCDVGVRVGTNGVVRLNGCLITGNTIGVLNDPMGPGLFESRLNNFISGNNTEIVGSKSTIPGF